MGGLGAIAGPPLLAMHQTPVTVSDARTDLIASASRSSGECHFCVRIATAPWPDGLETQNTDEHTAAADSSVPAAPVVSAGAV